MISEFLQIIQLGFKLILMNFFFGSQCSPNNFLDTESALAAHSLAHSL